MKDGNQIELWYRFSSVDKEHQYSVVCRGNDRGNHWILWLWYRMGEQFTKKEKKQFRVLPYSNEWDITSKLIKEYKTVNNGVDRIIQAIRNHFKKLKP